MTNFISDFYFGNIEPQERSTRMNKSAQKQLEIMVNSEEKNNTYSRLLASVAAAAAKSLQSCPTLCDRIDGSPPGSPVPGILQARILEWVAISFSNALK